MEDVLDGGQKYPEAIYSWESFDGEDGGEAIVSLLSLKRFCFDRSSRRIVHDTDTWNKAWDNDYKYQKAVGNSAQQGKRFPPHLGLNVDCFIIINHEVG